MICFLFYFLLDPYLPNSATWVNLAADLLVSNPVRNAWISSIALPRREFFIYISSGPQFRLSLDASHIQIVPRSLKLISPALVISIALCSSVNLFQWVEH